MRLEVFFISSLKKVGRNIGKNRTKVGKSRKRPTLVLQNFGVLTPFIAKVGK